MVKPFWAWPLVCDALWHLALFCRFLILSMSFLLPELIAMKREQRQIKFPLSLFAWPPPEMITAVKPFSQSGVGSYDVMSHTGQKLKSQVRTKWAKKEADYDDLCLPDILFPEHWLFLHFLFGTFGHLREMRRRLPLTH